MGQSLDSTSNQKLDNVNQHSQVQVVQDGAFAKMHAESHGTPKSGQAAEAKEELSQAFSPYAELSKQTQILPGSLHDGIKNAQMYGSEKGKDLPVSAGNANQGDSSGWGPYDVLNLDVKEGVPERSSQVLDLNDPHLYKQR